MNYQDKIISVEQALALVKDNDQIVTGLAAAEAKLFVSNLHTIADKVTNVTLNNCLPMSDPVFLKPEYKHSFNLDGWFFAPALRKAFPQGNVSFIPNHLHLAGRHRLENIHPNIFVCATTMPDKHGYVSLSLSNTYESLMVKAADIVIFEINPNFPRTFGDVEVHLSEVDYLIEADYEPPTIPGTEPDERDMKIGKQIASMIHDGDTLQLGIGGIPNAVAAYLDDKKDLGIHTEMMTSGMMDLIERGVITNKKKNFYPGKSVCTFALGSKELYDYLDDNPSVAVLSGAFVNDPYVIRENDNMVSINTALEVDLTGQVCSESIGPVQFSGTGGQVDTAIGAQLAKNGRSFIALYSTAMVKNPETGEREEVSKIVPMLKQGAIVTLSRNDVDYVVTEYGMVRLRGANVRERMDKLISIAHPKFRDEIRQQAMDLGLMPVVK